MKITCIGDLLWRGPPNKPVTGAWYWVTNGENVWTAICDPSSAGGWSNDDTWEDFSGGVKRWKLIPTPKCPSLEMDFLRRLLASWSNGV